MYEIMLTVTKQCLGQLG